MWPRSYWAASYWAASYWSETGGLPRPSAGHGFRGAGKMYLPWIMLADRQRIKSEQAALRRSVNSARAINAANFAIEQMYQNQMARSASYTILLAEV